MKTIFLIQGSAGQWDDYHTWIVCGGFDKSIIEEKCNYLNEETQLKLEKGRILYDKTQRDEYDFPLNLTEEEMELYHYYTFNEGERFQVIETEVI